MIHWITDGSHYALVEFTEARCFLIPNGNYYSGFLNDATPDLERFLSERGCTSTGILGTNRTMRYKEGTLEQKEKFVVVGKGHWMESTKYNLDMPSTPLLVITSGEAGRGRSHTPHACRWDTQLRHVAIRATFSSNAGVARKRAAGHRPAIRSLAYGHIVGGARVWKGRRVGNRLRHRLARQRLHRDRDSVRRIRYRWRPLRQVGTPAPFRRPRRRRYPEPYCGSRPAFRQTIGRAAFLVTENSRLAGKSTAAPQPVGDAPSFVSAQTKLLRNFILRQRVRGWSNA